MEQRDFDLAFLEYAVKQKVWLFLCAGLAWLVLVAIGATLRLRVVGGRFHRQMLSRGGGFIYAIWHGRIFLPLCFFPGPRITGLVSQHRDGELIKRILTRLGYKTVRGSTTSGGTKALKELLFQSRRGTIFAVTPDGPKGPAKKVQPGVIFLAQRTGMPILPASGAARKRKFFASWDRFMLPLPFSKSVLVFGPPIFVKPSLTETEFHQECLNLERSLNEITELAERVCQG